MSQRYDQITNSTGVVAIPVATTSNVYTPAIKVGGARDFAVELKAASSGTIDVSVKMEVSMSAPAASEEAIDAVNWVVPDGLSEIKNLVNSTMFAADIAIPAGFPYVRFLLDGQGSNDASTTVALKVGKQYNRN